MPQFIRDAKRWLPGAIISILIVAALLYFVDLPKFLKAIQTADYGLLAIVLVLAFVWMFVRVIVWRTLLRDRATYRDALMALSEGYLLNNVLPFRLGEIGRAFMLSRKTDMTFVEILPSIVIERATDVGFTAAIFLASLPFVVGAAGADRIGIIIGVVVVVGFLAMYLLARNDQWALQTFHKLSARWPSLQHFGRGILESFLTGLTVLTDVWLFIRFLFWMTLNWGIALITYYLTIRAFFPQTQIAWGMFGLGAAAFGGAVPSLPGAVGTFEGAFAGALTLLTHDQSTSLAVALASRLFNYISSGVLGGYALAREGQTLSGIYRQLAKFRSKAETYDSPL